MSLARDICFIFWGAVGRAVGNFSPGAPYCTSSLLESFISGSGDICHPLCILFFSSHIIFRFCSGLPFAWRCGRSHKKLQVVPYEQYVRVQYSADDILVVISRIYSGPSFL